MNVSWLGQSAIKIEYKHGGQDAVVLIDPYKQASEDLPRSFTPDTVLLTHGDKDVITLSREPLVISDPGEYEHSSALVFGISSDHEDKKPAGAPNVLYRFEIEGVSLVHLGRLHRQLSDAEMERLENIDVLFVPVGGAPVLDTDKATEIVTRLEPRIVIPICFKAKGTGAEFKVVETFVKASGLAASAPEAKMKIVKKDLPMDETKLVVLEKT